MSDEVNIYLDSGSEEAQWANQVARELVTARLSAVRGMKVPGPMPLVFTEAVGRAIVEAFETYRPPQEVARRVAYLVAAQAAVAFAAVVTAGQAMEIAEIGEEGSATDEVLPILARVFEDFGQRGIWL